MFDTFISWLKDLFNPTSEKAVKATQNTLKAQEAVYEKPVETPVVETPVVEEETSKNSYSKTELNKMTKGKLVDLAKADFDLSVDIKLKKAEIVEEILNVQK